MLQNVSLAAIKLLYQSCQPFVKRSCAHWPEVPIFDDITTYTPKGDQLTLFAADSLAKTSASPAEKPASKKALGQVPFTNSCESFAWWSQDSSSWKTSQRSLLTGWPSFSESWPRQGLMQSGMHSSKCCGACHQRDRWPVAYSNNIDHLDRTYHYPACVGKTRGEKLGGLSANTWATTMVLPERLE